MSKRLGKRERAARQREFAALNARKAAIDVMRADMPSGRDTAMFYGNLGSSPKASMQRAKNRIVERVVVVGARNVPNRKAQTKPGKVEIDASKAAKAMRRAISKSGLDVPARFANHR